MVQRYFLYLRQNRISVSLTSLQRDAVFILLGFGVIFAAQSLTLTFSSDISDFITLCVLIPGLLFQKGLRFRFFAVNALLSLGLLSVFSEMREFKSAC